MDRELETFVEQVMDKQQYRSGILLVFESVPSRFKNKVNE